MNLTEMSTIRSLCDKHGFALSKGFGQNFIVNAGICPKIVQASGINSEFGVIEIGPGFGVLTNELAAVAKKVVAIEVDDRLPKVLSETLAQHSNVKIILSDVLKCDLNKLINDEMPNMPVAVCANLPYYITSPIIMKILEERLNIEHLTVMVQKEAADRICAKVATRAAGAVSYAVNYYANPQVLFTVSPGSFYPPPKVTSAVIRLQLHKTPPVMPENEAFMFKIIRGAFSQRRKTAANAISAVLSVPKDKINKALEKCEISLTARPEQLTLVNYCNLSDIILQS